MSGGGGGGGGGGAGRRGDWRSRLIHLTERKQLQLYC